MCGFRTARAPTGAVFWLVTIMNALLLPRSFSRILEPLTNPPLPLSAAQSTGLLSAVACATNQMHLNLVLIGHLHRPVGFLGCGHGEVG